MHCLRIGLTSLALFQFSLGGSFGRARPRPSRPMTRKTTTPIKHVIVIIGENRSFDHVFATYVPKPGQTINNLLSEGIVKADGTPGPNFAKADQLAAVDLGEKNGGDPFLLTPPKIDFGGDVLPAPLVGGAKDSYIPSDSISLAEASETGLPTELLPVPGFRRHWPVLAHSGHAHHERQCPPGRALPADKRRLCSPTTSTPPAPCIASTRCGSNSIALPIISSGQIPPLQRQIVPLGRSHGRRRHQRPGATIQLQHRTTCPAPRPPVKARQLSASTTCSRATLLTSSLSPTPTP